MFEKTLRKLVAALVVATSASVLLGCGGGGDSQPAAGVAQFAGRMHAFGAAVTAAAASTVTPDMVLDWAEYTYPNDFPKAIAVRYPAVEYEGTVYNARAYTGTWGTRYLGIDPAGRVFGLGDFTKEQLQQFETVNYWAPQVRADWCRVSPPACANVAPVAHAGQPQLVSAGTIVTLDGTASSDANGDPLTYSWLLSSRPFGSLAVLNSWTVPKPTFVADQPGTYEILLVVSDGKATSAVASVVINAVGGSAQVVHALLYGGPSYSVYMGCLTCGSFEIDSVCSAYGTYGSNFSSKSIWNDFGSYGSPFSSYSPWNEFSHSGPKIIGTDGLFYGYFTANVFKSGRTTNPTFVRVLDFYRSSGSVAATKVFACGA